MAQGTPFVASGEPLMCTMGSAFNALKVTSQQVKTLGSQLQATEGDKTPPQFLENPSCFGTCSATGGKPCQAMIAIAGEWQKTDTHYEIQGQNPLTVASKLPCSKGGTIKFLYAELTIAIEMASVARYSYYDFGKEPEDEEKKLPSNIKRLKFSNYPDELKDIDLWKHEDSGFQAHLYQKSNGDYIAAFRGTETGEMQKLIKDGNTNIRQGIGLTEEQYDKANRLAERLNQSSIADQTSMAGHSLGGGLASLAGAQSGLPTYTYNAAGVHRNTLARYGLENADASHVQAYFSDDDVLSMTQDNRRLLLALMPSSPRYAPKGAEAGMPVGKAIGGTLGEFTGGMAEMPGKVAGQLLEWGGNLDQSVGSALEKSNIPGIEDLGAFMHESGGAQITEGKALNQAVEPWSDHSRQWGRAAGGPAGAGVGAGIGTVRGMGIDSNPIAKLEDVLTTGDLPDAQGTRREVETDDVSNPIDDHSLEPLIEALEALQGRGAKHYTTSK